MQILTLQEQEELELQLIKQELKSGGVVVIPTETVYGLAANAFDEQAVNKIFEVKGRPKDNPLIVHISNLNMLNDLVREVPEKAKKLMNKFWPGPLTLVMKKQDILPDEVTCGLDTVGIRMPKHELALKIIEKTELPLAAPSANLSGKPSPTEVSHCVEDLGEKVNFIVDGGRCEVGVESTVLLVAEEPFVILRPGIITKKQIEDVLQEKVLINDGLQPKEDKLVKSPGVKYKHYAPKAEVLLIVGNSEEFKNYIEKEADLKTCAMVFEDEINYFSVKCFSYGKQSEPKSLAKNIFTILRQVDTETYKRMFVHMPEQNAETLVIWNRLIRAASFKLINLN
ncbi:MAG: L-threonylcarbamoyladenylate synthase [Oscillospiraceae bacterium]